MSVISYLNTLQLPLYEKSFQQVSRLGYGTALSFIISLALARAPLVLGWGCSLQKTCRNLWKYQCPGIGI